MRALLPAIPPTTPGQLSQGTTDPLGRWAACEPPPTPPPPHLARTPSRSTRTGRPGSSRACAPAAGGPAGAGCRARCAGARSARPGAGGGGGRLGGLKAGALRGTRVQARAAGMVAGGDAGPAHRPVAVRTASRTLVWVTHSPCYPGIPSTYCLPGESCRHLPLLPARATGQPPHPSKQATAAQPTDSFCDNPITLAPACLPAGSSRCAPWTAP